jgi:hypothetical protein
MGSYYALKGHPASSQRGIILAKPTQIIWSSRQLGGASWSGQAVAQRRPRVSILGLKELAGYHSTEMTVEKARLGASGQNKRATLTKHLLKRDSWTTALSLIE